VYNLIQSCDLNRHYIQVMEAFNRESLLFGIRSPIIDLAKHCNHLIITFIGHGSEDGALYLEKSEAVDLNKIVENIREIREKCVRKSKTYSICLPRITAIFGSCYAHKAIKQCRAKENGLEIVTLTNDESLKTLMLYSHVNGQIENSIHTHLHNYY